jgi:hypothetical protein
MNVKIVIWLMVISCGALAGGTQDIGCDVEFVKQGTTLNGYNTTQWLSIHGGGDGFDCGGAIRIDRLTQSGDKAFFENDFNVISQGTATSRFYRFGVDLDDMLKSFQHQDRIHLFQVLNDRNAKQGEQRFLNIHLIRKIIDSDGPIGDGSFDGWTVKIVWFLPVGNGFEKTIQLMDLENVDKGEVRFELSWSSDTGASELWLNNKVFYNPYSFRFADYPHSNRLGYIGANTTLSAVDEVVFFTIVAQGD